MPITNLVKYIDIIYRPRDIQTETQIKGISSYCLIRSSLGFRYRHWPGGRS